MTWKKWLSNSKVLHRERKNWTGHRKFRENINWASYFKQRNQSRNENTEKLTKKKTTHGNVKLGLRKIITKRGLSMKEENYLNKRNNLWLDGRSCEVWLSWSKLRIEFAVAPDERERERENLNNYPITWLSCNVKLGFRKIIAGNEGMHNAFAGKRRRCLETCVCNCIPWRIVAIIWSGRLIISELTRINPNRLILFWSYLTRLIQVGSSIGE